MDLHDWLSLVPLKWCINNGPGHFVCRQNACFAFCMPPVGLLDTEEKLWRGLKFKKRIWRRQFNLCSLTLTHTAAISCFIEKFYPSASSCAFHFLPLFDFLPFFCYFVPCYTPVWSPRVLPLSLFPPVSPHVSPLVCFRFLFLALYFGLALTFNLLNFAIALYFPFVCNIVLASFVFLFGILGDFFVVWGDSWIVDSH